MPTRAERWKDWARRNPEIRRAAQARWYKKNAERIRAKNASIAKERVIKHREYYKKHPEKLKLRWLKSGYKMTLEDYDRILASQDGACAICNGHDGDKKRGRLCVDHDHSTGSVRGLLCGRCNMMLGLAKDSVENLLAAIMYLIRDEKKNAKY